MLNEELLNVWLRLTNIIDNQRLAAARTPQEKPDALPFNEAMVCGLLAQAAAAGRPVTASGLCRQTRILKSQMNVILRSLEGRGMIVRRRSQTDRRQIELHLLPAGRACYEATHRRALEMTNRLIAGLGPERVQVLLPLLRQAADIFETIQEEE